jgi:hypothetical protein
VIRSYDVAPVPYIEIDEEDGRPAQRRFAFRKDPAASSQGNLYPSSPVALGFAGTVRGQNVAQVRFYPIQVDPPHREIRVYSRLVVRVTFEGQVLYKATERDHVLRGLLLNDPPGGGAR